MMNEQEDFAMKPTAVSDGTFDSQVLHAKEPVLVDFWAEWCGPCKMVAPFLDELAEEMAGRLTVAKVNIDENPQTPRKFGVRGIPTMILFKDGQVAATKIGALPKSKLYEWIESVL
jgi:thioredoxin 1